MTNAEARIVRLEQKLRKDELALANLANQLATALQAMRVGQSSSPFGSGGGAGIYSMAGVVIAAGGSVTGATVNQLVNGSTVGVSTNATVYNQMQSPTITGKTIMLGQNPDGSFSAISQSC